MHLGQVISNPDLEGDYSPIYSTEKKWVRTRKKSWYGPDIFSL